MLLTLRKLSFLFQLSEGHQSATVVLETTHFLTVSRTIDGRRRRTHSNSSRRIDVGRSRIINEQRQRLASADRQTQLKPIKSRTMSTRRRSDRSKPTRCRPSFCGNICRRTRRNTSSSDNTALCLVPQYVTFLPYPKRSWYSTKRPRRDARLR